MRNKYIRLESGFIVWPESIALTHKEMARKFPADQLISAGFLDFVDGRFCCYGKSTSLRLNARSEDGDLVEKQFRGE